MEKDKKYLWEILVPKLSNDGEEFSIEFHRRWDEKIRKISGGLTVLKPAKGHWVKPNEELMIEDMIPVKIYCTEKEIDEIIKYTLDYYSQDSIFAYKVSDNVKLVHREK